MKKTISFVILTVLLLSLAACSANPEDGTLCGIVFERGSGSQWGNQFYIEVQPGKISQLRYIPEGSSDLEQRAELSITAGQWEMLVEAVEQLPLEKKRERLKLDAGKLDGGDFRNLTLQWQTGETVRSVSYRWPDDPAAVELERLLEELAVQCAASAPENQVESNEASSMEEDPRDVGENIWVIVPGIGFLMLTALFFFALAVTATVILIKAIGRKKK